MEASTTADRVIARISDLAEVPVASVGLKMTLVDDLNLDSFALAELAAFVADGWPDAGPIDGLLSSTWNGLTVGELITQLHR